MALTRRNNDDDEEDDDADNQAHAHLHVLPPHLLAYTVGAPSEALRGDGKVVGLILQRVEAGTALGNLVDVVAHDANSAVDFLESVSAAAYMYGTMLRVQSVRMSSVGAQGAAEASRPSRFDTRVRRTFLRRRRAGVS